MAEVQVIKASEGKVNRRTGKVIQYLGCQDTKWKKLSFVIRFQVKSMRLEVHFQFLPI